MDDISLKNRILVGDETAINDLVDIFGNIVNKRVSSKLSAYPNYVEECINDVFLGVWQNIDHFDPSKNTLKNWVLGVTRYKILDYLRKIYREKTRIQVGLEEHFIDTIPYENSEIDKLGQDIEEELSQILSSLNPLEKELLIRRYVNGQTIDQISREISSSKKYIYNKIFYAKKKVKSNLSKTDI